MKTLFTVILFLQTYPFFGQVVKPAEHSKKVEQVITDLNNDNRVDTVILYSNLKEPGFYNKIEISITGGQSKAFFAKNGWTNVDSKFLQNNRNEIQSNRLFVYKAAVNPVILLSGPLDGAGFRADFTIISIIDNKPELIFRQDEKHPDIEVPISISDLNKDGQTQFVCRNIFEYYQRIDSLNTDIAAYSPYLVYTIRKSFRLNKQLTKAYNEKHYVFAGYEYSEKIKVLLPRNGRRAKILN